MRMLDAMYETYEPIAQEISSIIIELLDQPWNEDNEAPIFSSRPVKSLPSIISKLERERTRLSSMQDLIGCRIIVQDRTEQEILVGSLRAPPSDSPEQIWARPMGLAPVQPSHWPFLARTIDRNNNPMHGYRAIHLVVTNFRLPYEIQIRTRLQDRWGQVSEQTDDLFPGTKYGKGPASVLQRLLELSSRTDEVERDYYSVKELPERFPGEMDDRFIARHEARVTADVAHLLEQYDEFERLLKKFRP